MKYLSLLVSRSKYTALLFFLSVALVHAEGGDGTLINPLAGDMTLMQFVTFLVRDVLVGIIAPIVLTLALLYTGFMFISAQGNPSKLQDAQRNFVYVIVGGILLLGAYVILAVITNTVDQLTVN
ncbi:MAG: hypothetical protein ACKKL4_00220 [Patescibacteria group bacterium]